MKKIAIITLLALVAVSFMNTNSSFGEKKDPLASMLDSDLVIKTYVENVKNSSGDNKISLDNLKATLEDALEKRLPKKFSFSGIKPNKKFDIATNKSLADIVISSNITEYLWTNEDPVDMIIGIPAVAYDALTKENYARMQVIFTIRDAKTNQILWKNRLQATITDKTMTEAESYPRIEKRIVKIFLRDLFKEKKKGRN